jgi:CheY-like chemotaxis protein
MGGTVGVESVPGKGSTFWFTMRLEPSGSAHIVDAPIALAGKKVLIVDDNETNRTVLAQQLARARLTSVAVASAMDALAAVEQEQADGHPFDLAILDLHMPGVDGLMLARALRSKPDQSKLPLLLLASSTGRAVREQTNLLGFAACLTKPVRQTQLVSAIADALGVGARTGQTVAVPQCSGHVLVAEDNQTNQKVARLLLERLGCRVDTVANGREAVEVVEKARYDLVLMDCEMPELDGYGAAREIRRREAVTGRYSPIVALTANAQQGEREKCLAAGMNDYLSKPIRSDELAVMVNRWMVKSPSLESPPATLKEPPSDPVSARLRELAQSGFDEQDLHQLITTFLDTTPITLRQLITAMDRGEWDVASRAAHSMRGSLGSVGFEALEASMGALEGLCRTGDVADARSFLSAIEREFEERCGALATLDYRQYCARS